MYCHECERDTHELEENGGTWCADGGTLLDLEDTPVPVVPTEHDSTFRATRDE